jgi:hypothetical protein
MLANFSREELTSPKATVLGVADETSEELVDAINIKETTNEDFPTKQGSNNTTKKY